VTIPSFSNGDFWEHTKWTISNKNPLFQPYHFKVIMRRKVPKIFIDSPFPSSRVHTFYENQYFS
jgi:hypothetical protein